MLRIGQVEVTATSDGKYTDGSVAGGIAATRLRATAFNAIQEELAYIVESAAITLNINDTTQVLTALKKLFLSRSNPFSDIKADGAAAIATALSNLELGDGSALPVGTPIPWSTSTPPTGWLKCNGATFTAAQYPKLALAYPGLVLPDLRGQFIRGWDDGRGLDSGRSLLSAQSDAIRNITGQISDIYGGGLMPGTKTGALSASTVSGPGSYYLTSTTTGSDRSILSLAFNASGSVPTASENRPVNIAFNYIVRAA